MQHKPLLIKNPVKKDSGKELAGISSGEACPVYYKGTVSSALITAFL
jgi:hypothetical protein